MCPMTFSFLALLWQAIKFLILTALALAVLFWLTYLVVPRPAKDRMWAFWVKFGHALGTFNARAILTLFYWTVFAAYAIAMKPFVDPLHLKCRHVWLDRKTRDLTLDDARKQS